jgi:hypothetical protein
MASPLTNKAYWLFSSGSRAVTSDGAAIIFDRQPAPVPVDIDLVLSVRCVIDDPHLAAGQGIVYAKPRPFSLIAGAITTVGDGVYYRFYHGDYHRLYPVISDFTILGITNTVGYKVHAVAVAAIQRLIAMLNPRSYVTSFSTGGQSTSFPSFSEALQYYKDLQASINSLYSRGKVSWSNPPSLPVGGLGW